MIHSCSYGVQKFERKNLRDHCYDTTSLPKSLPNNKFLDWSSLKALADDKINVTETLKSILGRVENNYYGKRRKWW